MHTSSSANFTCSEFSSASEYTATVLMPSSRHAWMMRRAISPRLAIRIFLNIELSSCSRGLDGEEPFPVLHRLTVLDVGLDQLAVALGVDLVHELHGFDDAKHLPLVHHLPELSEGFGARLRRAIEGAD